MTETAVCELEVCEKQSGEKLSERRHDDRGRKLTNGDEEPERDVEEGEQRDKAGICAKRCEQVDQDEDAPPC